jgi:two-component system LytT family sensor kinase
MTSTKTQNTKRERQAGRNNSLPIYPKRGHAQKLLRWLLVLGVFSIIGIVDGLNSFFTASSSWYPGQYHVGLGSFLPWYVLLWDLWVPFIPLVLWTGRRFRFDRERWYRSVPVYFLAGLVLSTAHTVLVVIVSFLTIYDLKTLPAFVKYKPFVLLSTFLNGIVVYGLILALGLAWDYYVHYREGQLRSSQLEAMLAQSQTQALRMQLHPHFLFNTLNSISALQLEDVSAAQRMMARLGDFLRMTLEGNGEQQVTLKKEMEFLNCYLEIERIRFGERLTTSLKIDPDALDVKVPTLILQPLVENAIRHGVSRQIKRGEISILARRQTASLLLQVRDNGSGVAIKANGECAIVEGVGLSNTRLRLECLYGTEARITYENAPEGGLIATIEIPLGSDDDSN